MCLRSAAPEGRGRTAFRSHLPLRLLPKALGKRLHASAHFAEEQILEVSGESNVYNGLEIDGVGAVGIAGGIDYHFCKTCGSTVYWISPLSDPRFVAIAMGNFVDPDFPVPTTELFTKDRHHWVPPLPGATQVHDPLDGSMAPEEMVPTLRQDAATE